MLHKLKCKRCGTTFESKRIDSMYCGNTCRTYASREGKTAKRKNRKGNTSLSGFVISPTQNPIASKTERPVHKPVTVKQPESEQNPVAQKLTFADMPTLRGCVEPGKTLSADLPPAPEPPAPFELVRLEELQPVFETYYLSVPNPEYKRLSELRNKHLNWLQHQSELIDQQQKVLKDVKQSTNVTTLHYALAATAGGATGYNLSNEKNKMSGTFLGAVLAITAMRAYAVITQDEFERQKKQAIITQEKTIEVYVNQLRSHETQIEQVRVALSKESELLSVPKTRLSNVLQIEKRKKEIVDYEKQKLAYDVQMKDYQTELAEYNKKYPSHSFSFDAEKQKKAPAPLVNDPSIISGGQLLQGKGSGKLLLQGKWKAFLGEPSRDFLMALHGPSGSGKSHFAVQFGLYLNVHHGTVLYVSGEEGHSDTMREKLSKFAEGLQMRGYDFADIGTKEQLMQIVPTNRYNFIILDSINNMGIDAKDLRELVNYYCCSGIIAICQNTKKGDIRGSYEVVHDSDIKIRVENGIAYTDKNRYIDTKPELEVFTIGRVPPVGKIRPEKKEEGVKQSDEGGKIISLQQEGKITETDQSETKNNPDEDLSDSLDLDSLDHIL